MDWAWAEDQLQKYLDLTHIPWYKQNKRYLSDLRVQEEIVDGIIEDCFVEPGVDTISRPELAQRALARARHPDKLNALIAARSEEVVALSADSLNPYVWGAAEQLWRSGHYSAAVEAAAKSVNAMLQAKVGRRDTSESDLVAQCFSMDDPKPGRPRLRVRKQEGTPAYRAAQEGVMAFGRGCFMAIRNELAHADPATFEQDPDKALAQLAAFSLLADWIGDAQVVRHRQSRRKNGPEPPASSKET